MKISFYILAILSTIVKLYLNFVLFVTIRKLFIYRKYPIFSLSIYRSRGLYKSHIYFTRNKKKLPASIIGRTLLFVITKYSNVIRYSHAIYIFLNLAILKKI